MKKKNRYIEKAGRGMKYSLSLPERIIRSLAALAGGSTSLLTETLFPSALRETTIYNVSFGMMQRFILEKVAGIENEADSQQRGLGDDYLQRKMVGTALEAAGLLAVRFSPLWVFAIAGDAAGGSRVFFERLVRHLKRNDIISSDSKAADFIDVLSAIQEASGTSAIAIDTPPLSREKLSEMVTEMKTDYGRVFKTTSNLLPRLDALWSNMEQISRRENISLERLGGIITVDAITWSRKGFGLVKATGRTGAELLDEKILDSYRKTLQSISGKGVEKYMSSRMKPFLKASLAHFDPARETWIEKRFIKKKKK